MSVKNSLEAQQTEQNPFAPMLMKMRSEGTPKISSRTKEIFENYNPGPKQDLSNLTDKEVGRLDDIAYTLRRAQEHEGVNKFDAYTRVLEAALCVGVLVFGVIVIAGSGGALGIGMAALLAVYGAAFFGKTNINDAEKYMEARGMEMGTKEKILAALSMCSLYLPIIDAHTRKGDLEKRLHRAEEKAQQTIEYFNRDHTAMNDHIRKWKELFEKTLRDLKEATPEVEDQAQGDVEKVISDFRTAMKELQRAQEFYQMKEEEK